MKSILRLLVSFTLIFFMISTVSAQPQTLIWSDPVDTWDIALSKDGQYVASVAWVSGFEVRFYSKSSGTPIWTKDLAVSPVLSVAISADGDGVVVGGGGRIYYWKNAKSLTGNPNPTWSSQNLGPIERRCLDISDDGNYVVACGTGDSVFYWVNAKAKAGSDVPTTWQYLFTAPDRNVEAVDLSSDGDYVTAGVATDVAYWKNARSLTGNPAPSWYSTQPGDLIVDIAVSDDGNYVTAAGTTGPSPVYYWANAKTLIGDPSTTWESASGVDFSSIDMSSDGRSVIAGGIGPDAGDFGVYFWGGATGLSGTPAPTWIYATAGPVDDVTINDAGDFMAAINDVVSHSIYFFRWSGELLWCKDDLTNPGHAVSISGDGGTLAVATAEPLTSYLFDTGFSTLNPVGGYVIPINKLSVLAPYLAMTALIAAITIVATRKRRS